jgi:hypothetical protein
MAEEVLREEGLERKLSIEGLRQGIIEGCEGTVRDGDRGSVEGRRKRVKVEY